MKVTLKHIGFSPARNIHYYHAFAESGWAGSFEDEDFAPDGIYELPDDMFSIDSGWVNWQCDSCGLTFRQRSRPGGKITCPMCNVVGIVPEDATLEVEDD